MNAVTFIPFLLILVFSFQMGTTEARVGPLGELVANIHRSNDNPTGGPPFVPPAQVWMGGQLPPYQTFPRLDEYTNQWIIGALLLTIAFFRAFPTCNALEATSMGASASLLLRGGIPYPEDVKFMCYLLKEVMGALSGEGFSQGMDAIVSGLTNSGLRARTAARIAAYIREFHMLGPLRATRDFPLGIPHHVNPWVVPAEPVEFPDLCPDATDDEDESVGDGNGSIGDEDQSDDEGINVVGDESSE